MEVDCGHEALAKFLPVLIALQREKQSAEQGCAKKQSRSKATEVEPGGGDCPRDHKAAGQQDRGVCRSDQYLRMSAGFRKVRGVAETIDEVADDEHAEEQ